MKRTLKPFVLVAILVLTGTSIALLVHDEVDYRVDLHGVLELWGDLLRDVEHVPLSATRMSADEEMVLGDMLHLKHREIMGWPLSSGSTYSNYVDAVGRRLAVHAQRDGIHYRFHVVATSTINAYALPGGHVYVTTGLLSWVESEAQLAAVIGHEISHVALRHCVQKFQYERLAAKVVGDDLAGLIRVGRRLFEVGFSEQQELESDAGGMTMLAAAGYDPGAAVDVKRKLASRASRSSRKGDAKPGTMIGELGRAVSGGLGEYFKTHPMHERRVSEIYAAYRRNAYAWRGRRFYVGRSNLERLTPRDADERDNEWTEFREPDGPAPSPIADGNRIAAETAPTSLPASPETVLPPTDQVPVDPTAESPPDALPAAPVTLDLRFPVMRWGTATADSWIRKQPRYGTNPHGSLAKGERVYIIARLDDSPWLQVAVPHRRIPEGYVHSGDVTPRVSVRGHARFPMPPLVRRRVDTWHLIMKTGAVRTHPQGRAQAVAMATEGEQIYVPSYLSGSPWLWVASGQPGSFRYGYLEAWHLEDLKLAADDPAGPSGTASTGRHEASHHLAVAHWSTVRDRVVVRTAARAKSDQAGMASPGDDVYIFARAGRDSDWFRVRVVQQGLYLHGYLNVSVLALPIEMLPLDPASLARQARRLGETVTVDRWTGSGRDAQVHEGPDGDTPVTSRLEAGRRVHVLHYSAGSSWRYIEHHVQGSVHRGYVPASALVEAW